MAAGTRGGSGVRCSALFGLVALEPNEVIESLKDFRHSFSFRKVVLEYQIMKDPIK